MVHLPVGLGAPYRPEAVNGHRAPARAPDVETLLLDGRGACLGHEEVDVDLRHALERAADR